MSVRIDSPVLPTFERKVSNEPLPCIAEHCPHESRNLLPSHLQFAHESHERQPLSYYPCIASTPRTVEIKRSMILSPLDADCSLRARYSNQSLEDDYLDDWDITATFPKRTANECASTLQCELPTIGANDFPYYPYDRKTSHTRAINSRKNIKASTASTKRQMRKYSHGFVSKGLKALITNVFGKRIKNYSS